MIAQRRSPIGGVGSQGLPGFSNGDFYPKLEQIIISTDNKKKSITADFPIGTRTASVRVWYYRSVERTNIYQKYDFVWTYRNADGDKDEFVHSSS